MTSIRPATETGRLLVAATIGVCLFFVLYGRLLGSVAFLLYVGTGVLFLVLLAGYNGYDRGSERGSMLIAAGIMLGITFAMAATDVQEIASRGPGHADIPGGNGESLFWVLPAIALGLAAHRVGRYVENRRSPAEE